MSQPVTQKALRRRADIGLIVAFFVVLWLPTADTFLGLDRAPSPKENRALARFPEFQRDLTAMHAFVQGFEAYFSDHFGFRRQLVRWESHWKWQFFHDSRRANVVIGKDDWLYFSDGRMVDDIGGTRPFKARELDGWLALLTSRRDWLAQRGIRYLFVIPPDKHTIYPEHLPDWLTDSARSPRRLDQFVTHIRAHSDIPILDLRGPLLEAKTNERVYQQTDTHWNDAGAFAGAREILRVLISMGLSATPLDVSEFQKGSLNTPVGDLALMLGRDAHGRENDVPFLAPRSPLEIRIAPELLPKKWIPGTEPRFSDNPAAKARAVVFRDSFAIRLSTFLGHGLGRVVYVWQQNWDKRIIESEKPDVVVDEMVERFLISIDPYEVMKSDDRPEVQLFGDR